MGSENTDERLARIEEQISGLRVGMQQILDELRSYHDDHEQRIRALEASVAKQTVQVKFLASVFAAIQLITNAIAGYLLSSGR